MLEKMLGKKKNLTKNYRPITLLIIFSKIIENVVLTDLFHQMLMFF